VTFAFIAFPDLVKYKPNPGYFSLSFNPYRGCFGGVNSPQVSPGAIHIQPLSGLERYFTALYFIQAENAIFHFVGHDLI